MRYINGHLLKANMRMYQDRSNEKGVERRVERAIGKWCHGKRNDAHGDQSFKSPMIAAVCG